MWDVGQDIQSSRAQGQRQRQACPLQLWEEKGDWKELLWGRPLWPGAESRIRWPVMCGRREIIESFANGQWGNLFVLVVLVSIISGLQCVVGLKRRNFTRKCLRQEFATCVDGGGGGWSQGCWESNPTIQSLAATAQTGFYRGSKWPAVILMESNGP